MQKKIVAITLLTVLTAYTLYTYSTALYAFIAPSEFSNRVGVRVFNTYTDADVKTSTFDLGDEGKVKATIELATGYYIVPMTVYSNIYTDKEVKASIAVYMDDGGIAKILGFMTRSLNLQPGVPVDVELGFKIPSDGVVGSDYYAKIYVWDDYLPSGGEDQIDLSHSAGTVPERVFTGGGVV